MIKFACPGCAAVFSVGDEKAGKTGKCPKCSAQFQIPEAEPPAVGAAPPPPPAEDPGVEIKPCPGCQAKLTVSPGDLGLDVECPYCKTVYKAKKLGGTATAPVPAADDRPSRRPRDDDEDDDRPKRRSRRDDDEDDDRPSRRRDRYDDDEDDRPSRKKRRRSGRSYEPHRGGQCLAFVIIGFFCCFILTIVGVIQATGDLAKMRNGQMDPEGQGMTRAAQIIGIIALCLQILGILVNVGLAVAGGGR